MTSIRTLLIIGMFPLLPLAATTGGVHGVIRCIDCMGWPPIAGVTVTVSGTNGTWKSTTDSHGLYVIVGITPGRYKISVIDRSMVYLPHSLRSVRLLCIHAGDYRKVNLFLGHSIVDPAPALVRRAYSVGECVP